MKSRLGAYRDSATPAALDAALVRNLYRGTPPGPAALAHARDSLMTFRDSLAATPTASLLAGTLP